MIPRQAFIPEARRLLARSFWESFLMRLVLPFRLAPDTLAAPVPGPQHFLMNHPEKRKPGQVQRHRYKKQDVEGGVLSAALKLGNVNTRETSEISKFLLR